MQLGTISSLVSMLAIIVQLHLSAPCLVSVADLCLRVRAWSDVAANLCRSVQSVRDSVIQDALTRGV